LCRRGPRADRGAGLDPLLSARHRRNNRPQALDALAASARWSSDGARRWSDPGDHRIFDRAGEFRPFSSGHASIARTPAARWSDQVAIVPGYPATRAISRTVPVGLLE